MSKRDGDLEAAIDSVGRSRVFARANSAGWFPPDTPPDFVWWAIVDFIRAEDAGRPSPPRKDET